MKINTYISRWIIDVFVKELQRIDFIKPAHVSSLTFLERALD